MQNGGRKGEWDYHAHMKYWLPVALILSLACAKKENVEPPAVATETTPAPSTQAPAPAPVPTQTAATLPAGSPIPTSGVLLWLSADDAVAAATDGKLRSWQNTLVPAANATPRHADRPPAVVANAVNGHAVIRFDGTDQTLMSNVDIGPTRMPEGTIVTVLRSTTAEPSPLRKIYGNDNGGYDRAVGLDTRGRDKNFTLFKGSGVEGYFKLQPDTTYIVVDQYSPKEFSGWVNGNAALTNVAANWQDDALPNLFIGGTGTVYNEFWSGDLAEILVYARKLSDAERLQVEDYLGQKYGVAITRGTTAATASQ